MIPAVLGIGIHARRLWAVAAIWAAVLPVGIAAESSPYPVSTPALSPTPLPPSPSAVPSPRPARTPDPAAPRPGELDLRAQDDLIESLTASEASALALQRSLGQLQAGLLVLGKQVLEADQALSQLDQRLTGIRIDQARVATRLDRERAELAALVRGLYKRQHTFVVALLESGGFGGLLRTAAYGGAATQRQARLVRSIQADERALLQAQASMERTRAQQQAVLDRLTAGRAELTTQVETQWRLLGELQGATDEALTALHDLQGQSPAAAQHIARLIRVRTDALLAQIQLGAWFAPRVGTVPLDAILQASSRGAWPISQATVTQAFGPTPFAFEPAYAGFAHFHTGIDLATQEGQPVRAAADGLVVGARPMTDGAGTLIGYGNFVILEHDGNLKTLYAHLKTMLVKEGQTVRRGQLVGLVGSTGNSTGSHTHFEVRIANTPVDPVNFLTPTPD